MKALLFAAGKGTRLKPFTDEHPKALMPVNGIPLLQRNIQYLQNAGINDFVINIHHFGYQINDFLKENDNFGAKIQISDERLNLLETGGGLVYAKKYLENEPHFLVMNADILTDLSIKDFIRFHEENNNFVTLAVSDRDSSRKLLFNEKMMLKGWENLQTKERKLAENFSTKGLRYLAFSGIHCMNSEIFDKITRTGKFSIMDEYLDMMRTENIRGYQHKATLVDVGKPESVIEAEKLFK